MALMREHTGMADAWAEVNSSTAASTSIGFSAEDAIRLFGITADSPMNTYSAGKPLDAHAVKHLGKRLDYIFYRNPVGDPTRPKLSCSQCRVVFTEKVPGTDHSFSDHFGLEATIAFSDPSQNGETALPSSRQRTLPHVSDNSASLILQALTASYRLSQARSRLELSIFCACVFILLVLLVSSAWLPRSWVNPIFILLTAVVTWLGTTMLYSGFIFGNWERRALMNVIEQLELSMQVRRGYAQRSIEENSEGRP